MQSQNFDKEVTMDLLKDMKFFSECCQRGAMEASNQQTRSQCIQMMNDHLDHQWALYKLADQKGWYKEMKPSS
ncbi:MAG: spore coat protein [Dethiobacteria bacterium]|nr:spore coat protein [Bacillota bacterium]